MKNAILQWWQSLSRREMILFSVAGGLVILLLLWAATFGPLVQKMRAARVQTHEAVDRNAVIKQRAAQIRRLAAQATQPQTMTDTARVDLILSQDAAERGFSLSRNDAAGDDTSNIAITNARSAALLGWINTLEERKIFASNLSIRPNADGTVAVTATMKRTRS